MSRSCARRGRDPPSASVGQGERDPEGGCDVGAVGIDVDEGDLCRRKQVEQASDAAADHACTDDRDPIADERRRVPQRIDGRLDGAGENGPCGRNAVRHDRDGSAGTT